MENRHKKQRGLAHFPFSIFQFLLSAFICVHLWLSPAFAQQPEQELVANLAAGRVTICVAKEGIVVAATENKLEPESRPPVVIELSGKRVAILLGAVEWLDPAARAKSVRLDEELPKLLSGIAGPRRLQQEQASDLENLGIALLEPLRAAASRLHRKIELAEDEPILEIILVGYVEDYGPEVWSLRYRIAQDPLRGDYWQTRVLRPVYNQLYPPEKGQPRTLMEARYPPEDAGPGLLELLRGNDPRLSRIRAADKQVAFASELIVLGESNKAPIDAALSFLRTAFSALTPQDQVLVLAVIREQYGFEWVLAPPARPERADDEQQRAPGAPSLRKKPPL